MVSGTDAKQGMENIIGKTVIRMREHSTTIKEREKDFMFGKMAAKLWVFGTRTN